eukprot:1413794-Rhodomonas_salina.2
MSRKRLKTVCETKELETESETEDPVNEWLTWQQLVHQASIGLCCVCTSIEDDIFSHGFIMKTADGKRRIVSNNENLACCE